MEAVVPEEEFVPTTREGFWTIQRALAAVGAAIFFLFIAIAIVGIMLAQISTEQAKGRERGYINRAAACRIQNGLGLPLDTTCLDSNVTRYYNPQERNPGASFRSDALIILCEITRAQGIKSPVCDAESDDDG